MENIKKYWYLALILLVTAGLGVVTFLTTQKLRQETPVAPTVPQATPQAQTQACTFSFSLPSPTPTQPGPSSTPSKTPTGQPSATRTPIPSNTPPSTNTPVPSNTPTNTRTPSPTRTPTNTPTPPPGCGDYCTDVTTCPSGMICHNNACRNEQYPDQTDCRPPAPTETPTQTPSPTPIPGAPTNTPVPTEAIAQGPTPTDVPTPEIPVAGTGPTILGMGALVAGFLLLILGLAF